MKTKEELNALKGEVETLNRKLAELTEEELAQVTGGERHMWVGGIITISGGKVTASGCATAPGIGGTSSESFCF